jgi:ribose transport system substrate-binding protein
VRSPRVVLVGVAAAGLAASLLVSTAGVAQAKAPKKPAGVVAALKALVPYENPNPAIVLPPLSATPPTGKTVDFITCPITICISIQDGVQAAAAKLGWTVNVIEGGVTPATWISAVDQAVQSPGDAVLGIGLLPNSAIATELTALAAKNIPWIADVSSSPVGANDMIANESSPAADATSGKVMADWIVANSNAHAHVAFFWDPAFSTLLPAEQDFLSTMNRLCQTCSVNVQSTSFSTGVGTTDPGQIVSYLQANPRTNYLVVADGDAMVGVTQAIAAAGLAGKVKIVTRSADVINIKDIAAGTETMGVTSEGPEAGWRMVDAAARFFLGDSLLPAAQPQGVYHVLTKADLPANRNAPWTVPHYQSYFLKAWNLG